MLSSLPRLLSVSNSLPLAPPSSLPLSLDSSLSLPSFTPFALSPCKPLSRSLPLSLSRSFSSFFKTNFLCFFSLSLIHSASHSTSFSFSAFLLLTSSSSSSFSSRLTGCAVASFLDNWFSRAVSFASLVLALMRSKSQLISSCLFNNFNSSSFSIQIAASAWCLSSKLVSSILCCRCRVRRDACKHWWLSRDSTSSDSLFSLSSTAACSWHFDSSSL